MRFVNFVPTAILLLAITVATQSCEAYLDAKPDKKLAVPSSLTDMQALLDNTLYTTESGAFEGGASSDEYYLSDADWESLYDLSDRNMYVWEANIPFSDKLQSGWSLGYQSIFTCNLVLENALRIDRALENEEALNNVVGQAYYHRGNAYLDLVGIWCKAYDPATAETDLGLPIRLTSDFNEVSRRSSLEDTYSQIIKDLENALRFLPAGVESAWFPSKAAAYGLLARTCLYMGDYEKAYAYSDSCLASNSTLMDYNLLSPTDNFPISRNNPENIAIRCPEYLFMLDPFFARINPEIIDMYDEGDRRKSVLFREGNDGSFRFVGSYAAHTPFNGVSVNEIYLIRAESATRIGRLAEAADDMDALLKTRFSPSHYVKHEPIFADDFLMFILNERRKELVMRGVRWMDVKRLNLQGFNITLERNIGGQVYTLPPNSLRSALPIPEDVIRMSGMEQNPTD